MSGHFWLTEEQMERLEPFFAAFRSPEANPGSMTGGC